MLEDLRVNGWSLRPCCMVVAYRIAHFCSVWRKKYHKQPVGRPGTGDVPPYHRMPVWL